VRRGGPLERALGKRGPGSGLRQATTRFEATQWLRVFEALGSPGVAPLLPHLALRAADAPALAEICPRAASSLRRILAETSEPDPLAQVNGVLVAVYAEVVRSHGARLARGVFALAAEGFPDDADRGVMARWEQPLRALPVSFAASGLPSSKRDVVVAIAGHHLAAVEGLESPAMPDGDDAAPLRWLVTLIRWRRFASVRRSLARVLTAPEREQLLGFVRAAAERDAPGVR
jgi:hypothetical protein